MSNFELLETIKFSDNINIYSNTFLFRYEENKQQIRVICSPFSNCQTFLISPFENLTSNIQDLSNISDVIKELRDNCNIVKKLCQIDIRYGLFCNIKDHIKVHTSMEYISTNGSKMVNLLVKL